MSHDSVTRPDSSGNYPPEPKVIAATGTAALVGFLVDAISNWAQLQQQGVLINGLPQWAEPFVTAAALALPTFYAGWSAKHQHRRPLASTYRAPDGQ